MVKGIPHPSNGFVGYDADGLFVHYCHCGAWGLFSRGFRLPDQLGEWFCLEHMPADAVGKPERVITQPRRQV